MSSYVTTDQHGQFILDGNPWFYHGVTYFGRRPGTCGANWLKDNFAHNFAALPNDLEKMKDLGLNALGLFIPGPAFFDGLEPVEDTFEQLDRIIDAIANAGLRVVVFPPNTVASIPREIWCTAHGVEAGTELWNPAINDQAAQSQIYALTHFARRYANRPEVIGYMGRVGRFDFTGWDPPEALSSPVYSAWSRWLQDRFHGDFALARELLALDASEDDWSRILMPAQTPANYSRANPRSYEYGVMQHVLISRANARLNAAVKEAAPKQLMITDMEGVEIPVGLINVLVPELATADALWLECYNWEGMRGQQVTSDRHQVWLVEPNAGKPAVDLIGNAGYVQMLIRWMQQSGKAIIICHGTDIGEDTRGVSNEQDHALIIDRFNTFIQACGAHGINYWCFTDDEFSRSATRPKGFEYGVDTPDKTYQQAGETMGLLRFDGSERPACSIVRGTGRSLTGQPAATDPGEVLTLFPTPIFMSLYRYRASLTGYGLLTALARQGIRSHAAFTSAGEDLITMDRLNPYRLIILGMPEYHRDHPEMPALLRQYVECGGTLLLPIAHTDQMDDPYLRPRRSADLEALAGVSQFLGRSEIQTLGPITSHHRSFCTDATPDWTLAQDAWFTRVAPRSGAEILVEVNGSPLLYRHKIGQGSVYVFTWNLDVFLFCNAQLDYPGGHWDWIWQGLATEIPLTQEIFNPMSRTIRDMTLGSSVTDV